MANTVIQILRSYTTNTPPSLNDGELAYSFVSNTMFIGNSSNNVTKIGGEIYTTAIDSATAVNTPNTLILRDSNGTINVTVALIDGGGF